MEWDRQHSAFLYHLLSGGQPVHKDKLPRKTSPKIEPRTQPNQQHSRIGKQPPAASPKAATSIKNGREENNNKSTLAAIIEQQLPSPRVMALREQELAKDVQSLAAAAAERRQETKLLFIKVCWEIIAWSNEGWVWVALSPLFILLSFFYLDPASVAKVKYLYIMLFVDILLTGGIKFLTKRTRPSYNKGGLFVGPDIFSFPSGHSSRAMLLAHVSIFVFGWQSPWRAAGVMCWAALVAVSRLALGRHFLTDVMGGLTLGALEFWATFLFLQRFVFTA
ncbi:PAP2 superfamily domain containing protein [Acanthamoeba castellanii str. Neff]|jgi:hypothetical protein|uniref:PAP2 superfamily domain containing protein n=1 Tax=Acanthamoeba castellanii (strain ATCC 30010 / Neff) TaxID=1257118 RepID=L8H519_ACACF|nr:PAP2 superfamily domain containing protein [Acanthamoeba castellanii str. Neff]ELR20579.1 PAP2 superfamily domain containing protein [Acanthamoeba castellanii str. Neff]